MAEIAEQLKGMKTILEDSLLIGILVASVTVDDLKASTAAIKMRSDNNLKWEEVTARLIEEVKTLCAESQLIASVKLQVKYCEICNRKGHKTDQCFFNPRNPHNRLN